MWMRIYLTLLTCISIVSHGVSAVEITAIPTLGGNVSYAWDVNDSGVVVGEAGYNAGTARNAYVWSAQNGIIGLPTFGGSSSAAYSINNAGTVVGFANDFGSYSRAFKYSKSAGISLLPQSGQSSFASSINNLGDAVGGSNLGPPTNNQHGSRWGVDGSQQDLGVLAGASESRARAINESGVIVGECYGTFTGTSAFIWKASTGIKLIPTPSPSQTFAYGINDSGIVVGGEWGKAFRWSESLGYQALTLPGTSATSYGINNAGLIVGEMAVNSARRAFLWSEATNSIPGIAVGGLDLNTLLSPSDRSQWRLETAQSINNLNQVVGHGWFNNTYRGYIMSLPTVPEPAAIVLFACGVFVMRRHRMRLC